VHPAAAAGPRFARAGRRADGRPPGGGQAAVSADRAAHRRGAEAPPRRQGRGAGAHAAVPAPADGVTPEAENADAVLALKRGELIILPTETVYGLAADASNGEAVARIFEAKGRPRFNPLIAHVADAAAAERIAVFDAAARRLAEVFWPGPLTIVAPVRDRQAVCDLARAGLDTVAVRVPGHARAREILAAFGGPVVAPSANRSGRPSPTTFADALEETGPAASAGVDGGPCAVGVESTVVSIIDGGVSLLRPGSVTRADLAEALGAEVGHGAGGGHRSPGRLATHYAPEAPVRIEADGPGAD